MKRVFAKWYSLESAAKSFLSENNILIHYFELVCNNWGVILDPPICHRIIPYCWRGNTLVLAVEDNSYIEYIKMRESVIASYVRAVLGNDYCRNIAVKKVDFSTITSFNNTNSIYKDKEL